MATKFIIIRKDLDVDPTSVESDGLTIGRLVSNDLTLNHPAVSRTHAGIKEVGSDFWIFNLSNANGTILNGSTVDSAPLAAGDIIQLGPFTLYVSFPHNTLTLTVELSVNPLRAEGAGTQMLAPPDASGKTMMLSPQMLQAQAEKPSAGGTQRLSMTGKLTGLLAKPEEFALKVFWDKRKRDAGKMAESTLLKPNLMRGRVGKARFNWRSSSDLRRPWAVSLFIWGALVVTVVSVVSAFAFKNAYSPGPLADPHVRDHLNLQDPALAVANKANSNSCTTCHGISTSMQKSCAECHTTTAFKSAVSAEHEGVHMQCADCHGDQHIAHARDTRMTPASHATDASTVLAGFDMVVYAHNSCTTCHRAGYVYRDLETGKDTTLATPHGGETIGYPVANGQWSWGGWPKERWDANKIPDSSALGKKEQFHILHVAAGTPSERVQCSDCHTGGFDAANITKGVRESCAVCHNPNPDQNAIATTRIATGTQCTSCHQQHVEGKDPFAVVRTRQVNASR